jgi:outer membrane receptor protein involved in Fe transport
MRNRLVLTLAFLLLLEAPLFAAIGIVRGRVVDKGTKKPIFGVQVMVLQTTLGAITNNDGYYVINNVPVGTHTLIIRMMGYAATKKENILVMPDLPTLVNFELEKTLLKGREIVVEAEHPIFRKDVTASMHWTTGKDIEEMPVKSYQDVIELQPGVVAGHFRGGRTGEVLYLVDDIPIQDPTRGGPGTILPRSSVVEMAVRTGGFEAEYGKAMSGVVDLITREGGEELTAKFWGSFDKLGWKLPTYDVTSFDDVQRYEGLLSFPWKDRLRFFLSANYEQGNGRFKNKMLEVFQPPINEEANLTGKTTFKWASNRKVSLLWLYSYKSWEEYEHRWKKNLQGLPHQERQSYRISATLTHTLTSSTFYTFSLSQYNLLAQVFGKDARLYNPQIELDKYGYVVFGDKAWWQDNQQIISLIKADISSQRGKTHQMKAGGEFTYYGLNMNNVYYREMRTVDPNFPIYIAYQTKYRYYPKVLALYVQDKLQYGGLVADLGIRFDYFDPCAYRPAVERDPHERLEDWVIKLEDRVQASSKSQLSPRFGCAFPLGEYNVVRFNYGYFFQMPLFEHLYTNVDYNLNVGYAPLVGDPDLKAAKTIAYEASVKHFFSKFTVITGTIFSKEVSNLIDLERAGKPGYSKFVNMSCAYIKGIELDLQKVYGALLTGRVSYTYQIAKGTASTVGMDVSGELAYWGMHVPIGTYPLSWDQRHTLVVDVDVRRTDKWGVNVLWRWNSPLPYTPGDGKPNSERMWSRYWLDLKAEKILHPLNRKLAVYVEVKNLLDTKNIFWVDWYGQPGGTLSDPTAWSAGRRVWLGISWEF